MIFFYEKISLNIKYPIDFIKMIKKIEDGE